MDTIVPLLAMEPQQLALKWQEAKSNVRRLTKEDFLQDHSGGPS
jgi:hypothetical protein